MEAAQPQAQENAGALGWQLSTEEALAKLGGSWLIHMDFE